MNGTAASRRRGTPLVVLGVVLGAWAAGRTMLWESPFPLPELDFTATQILLAEEETPGNFPEKVFAGAEKGGESALEYRLAGAGELASALRSGTSGGYSSALQPEVAIGHTRVIAAAFGHDWDVPGFGRLAGVGQFAQSGLSKDTQRLAAFHEGTPPFFAPSGRVAYAERESNIDRWSLDAFAFYRSGSSSLSSTQGRVPVYGASQLAANLQYRLMPGSSHDPRAYGRAYHALVEDGETEVAAGLSARPVGTVPLRAAAELRVTRNRFNTEVRPAAYAVTEFAPQKLPLGLSFEAYAGAGYVGGAADTFFVDGQTGITREIVQFEGVSQNPVRFSLGGAAWGGAQVDAERLDVGPTMRIDLTVGSVPARLSVDWRERVAGDAEPNSGVAATLSTRF